MEEIVRVVIWDLCVVVSRLAWHVRNDVMKKLERYEEEGVGLSWKERSDELVRPVLECLGLLEKIMRVGELAGMRKVIFNEKDKNQVLEFLKEEWSRGVDDPKLQFYKE
jgi:hypothetical protein